MLQIVHHVDQPSVKDFLGSRDGERGRAPDVRHWIVAGAIRLRRRPEGSFRGWADHSGADVILGIEGLDETSLDHLHHVGDLRCVF